ncbi:hypothetical protein [Lysinibacillus sp. IITD104]|uniref:hypothetical protein n=1 Tax=unclassified Lysinibacillus TaxID=2636778 RepID=UPI002FD2EEB7
MRKITKTFITLFATFIVFGFVNKASATGFTQEQKELCYKEYVSIIEETNSNYDKDLKLGPIEDFTFADWKTPEEFKNIVTDMATQEWVPVEEASTYFALTAGKKIISRYLSGSFKTSSLIDSYYLNNQVSDTKNTSIPFNCTLPGAVN